MHHIRVGEFRGDSAMQVISGSIGREKIHYQDPPGADVPKQVEQFLTWWIESRDTMDTIIRVAIAGFWFVAIHPYEDGNGRLARAITDMACGSIFLG